VSNPETKKVTVRRAPKFPAFIIVGAGLGAIVTFILTNLFPVDPAIGFGAMFGYFALYGVTFGAVAGAILAIVLDRRATKRAKAFEVEVVPSEAGSAPS